jgi:hypothetical protein
MNKRKKYKKTNNDLQDITQKTKDRATWTPLLIGIWSGRLGCIAPNPVYTLPLSDITR